MKRRLPGKRIFGRSNAAGQASGSAGGGCDGLKFPGHSFLEIMEVDLGMEHLGQMVILIPSSSSWGPSSSSSSSSEGSSSSEDNDKKTKRKTKSHARKPRRYLPIVSKDASAGSLEFSVGYVIGHGLRRFTPSEV